VLLDCFAVDQKVLHRIEEAFRRHAAASGYLPQATFVREVMGESAPEKLSEVSLECRWWATPPIMIFAGS
jgi:hypothetical protein